MTGKRSTTLSGFLLSPLAVGRCALISHQGTLIRTSRVVAIHSMKHSEIRFYILSEGPYRVTLRNTSLGEGGT